MFLLVEEIKYLIIDKFVITDIEQSITNVSIRSFSVLINHLELLYKRIKNDLLKPKNLLEKTKSCHFSYIELLEFLLFF